ncbi:hypothetical protein [Mycobacterium sp. MUNTM1]
MIHLARNAYGDDGEDSGSRSELAHIPAPPGAAWIGEWHLFEGSCGHQYWLRHFGCQRWTVGTSSIDPVEVELSGCQFEGGAVEMWVCLESALNLHADEALMLATTLSRAADELQRIQGGSR